jgi:hypothetical protein
MNQGIVGTYAKEMHTAEGAVRSLSQSKKTLVQAFGSLFIPILQVAVPYVTAFVEILTDAVRAIAQFFGIELYKIDWSNVSNGIGGIAEGAENASTGLTDATKAAKKLKDYTMGFDELNVISPDTGSAGGGGAGGGAGDWGSGLDLDTIWDDAVLDSAKRQVDELKQSILDFADKWKWVFAIAGVAVGELAARKAWSTIAGIVTTLISQFSKVGNVISAVFGALSGNGAAGSALTFMFPTLTKIGTAISSAASAVGTFLAGISAPAWAIIAAVVAAIASAAYFLYENWSKVVQVVKDFFNENIAPKLEEINGHWENMKLALSNMAQTISDAIPDSVKELLVSFAGWIRDIVSAIGEWFASVDWLKAIGTVFEVIGGVIFGVVSGVIATAFNVLVGLIENIIQVFSGIVQVVSGVISLVVAVISGGDIGAAWETIWNGVVDVVKGLWGMLIQPIVDVYEGIVGWFTKLWDELVGHSIVPDIIDGIIEWFGKLPNKILGPLKTFVNDVIKKFKDMWSSIKSWFKESVAPKFTTAYWKAKFNTIYSSLKEKLNSVVSKIKEVWSSIKTWYNENVKPKFTLSYWKTVFDNLRSALKTKLDEAWKVVKNFFSVSEWKKKVTDAIGAIKDNFKLPSFPSIGLSVTYDTNVGKVKKAIYEALGLTGWPNLKWNAYATGGMPSMGEMFIAREAGPELVGRIGNHSAVANNDQIVEAVSRGVYDAVRAASGGDNGGQNINVYLDGKQIYASVKKTESQRGRNLMGNQLGYLY